MNAVSDYEKTKTALWRAERLRGLIGKRYSGGGGGTGRVHKAHVSLEVYFQEYDGARNYHAPDAELVAAINEVTRELGVEILDRAIERLRDDLEKKKLVVRKLLAEVEL